MIIRTAQLATPSEREVVLSRFFDAPRTRLFKAYTDPHLIPRWWGPRGFTTRVECMCVRPGGAWRFVQRAPDGNEYIFKGVYRGILRPDWLAYTFEFEGMPGHVMLETVAFEERDGKTKVTATALFDTAKDRDGMLRSGMEQGAADSWERLAELLLALA